MIRFKMGIAAAALIVTTGLAYAQESTTPAPAQDQSACPAPGSVPEAELPANCKVTSTTEQPKIDSDAAATTAPAQDGATGTMAPVDQNAATTKPADAQDLAKLKSDSAFLASRFIGQIVYSAADENVGEINDLVVGED